MERNETILDTRTRQSLQRREKILTAAMELFQEKCLEDTSMEEIAKKAGVGAATVYRYFSGKIQLVIEAAELYWNQISEKYLKELEKEGMGENGYEQLQKIFDIFCRIFAKQKPFLKFLQEFDVFVKKYQISEEHLAEYECGILKLKPYVTDSLERGLADKSLFFTCQTDEMYFSLTHALLAMMEKLAVGGDILSSDQIVAEEKQFHIFAELLLRGIKNR